MDIDAACKAKALSDACQHCRKTGHWAKDCDLCFNVHHMDSDELQTELENKLATNDAVPLESEPMDSIEDFVPCSE